MRRVACYIILLSLIVPLTLAGQIRLPRLVGDNAVLQRDRELNLYGWASANEVVTITLKGKQFRTSANGNGEWQVRIPPQKAGGPHEIVLSGKNDVRLKNILFGDVWLCSGQSNMELTMDRVREKYPNEIAKSKNTFIRHFEVPDRYNFKGEDQDLAGGKWQDADPSSIMSFSAVAYFFANDIYSKHGVPIGLVNAALGGSPVEAWLSEEGLRVFPQHLEEAKRFRNDSLITSIESSDRARASAWYKSLNAQDEGLRLKWKEAGTNDNEWASLSLPGYWSDQMPEMKNGSFWFRREININAAHAGKPAKLMLGRVVDQDSVFINGTFVGTTSYQYPPRRYEVPAGLLKPGKNSLTVRVISQSGKGGFVPDKPYYLAIDNDTLLLHGKWKFRMGATAPPIGSPTFIRWKPLGLFNGMIAPLTRLPIAGVIWYQGESNVGRSEEYSRSFPGLINDWRRIWKSDFPFYFVQLANFQEMVDKPAESGWADLRKSQADALALKNTGMAVAIDAGEWNDIHPLNKKVVGERLARLARKSYYGEKSLEVAGPQPDRYFFGDREVVIQFTHAKGLHSRGSGENLYFAISTDGKNFEWAETKISGSRVTLSNANIVNPTVVRYAWADNPTNKKLLYNVEGLPAAPFQLKKASAAD